MSWTSLSSVSSLHYISGMENDYSIMAFHPTVWQVLLYLQVSPHRHCVLHATAQHLRRSPMC